MRGRKLGIWPVLLACCTLVMEIGCDSSIDETAIGETAIGETAITPAQTASGAGTAITVSLEDDIIATAPAATTLYKDGNPTSVTIEAAKGYTYQWFVDGKRKGTNAGITLDSANFTTGDHFVTLIASKNGIPYSREYIITIVRQFR